MKPYYRNQAIIGLPFGLALVCVVLILSLRHQMPVWLRVILALSGLGVYLWGCRSLAKAKGYSSAILLTVVFGVLLPAILLLALPDKNKWYQKPQRSRKPEPEPTKSNPIGKWPPL